MTTRRERVVLELEDNFTSGMARAAASAALLNRELNSLSRDSIRTRSAVSDIDRPIQKVGTSSESSSREVDKLSGRMRILADVAAVLGPSLIPIGAVGVPAVTGLAAQLGFAAVAGGTAILAFQGIGQTLKDLNAAALNPTKQNLEKAQVALEGLSPAAQGFVAEIGRLLPDLRKLRDLAAGGIFPGATEGLQSLETALPHVQRVIGAVSQELGTIAEDAGASLASEKWTSFLDFIAQEAPSALADMATAAGHTAHAVAELWMATDPLNDDFSKWLVNATAAIDRWAGSLSKTQGFADFVAYVESTGPEVAAALGAIANAAIQIVQAAAPLGGPVLHGIEALANVVAAIADSDIGTPLFTAAAALALFNRTLAITGSLQKTTFSSSALAPLKGYSTRIKALSADLQAYNAVENSAAGRARATAVQIDAQAAAGARLGSNLRSLGRGAALVAGVGVAASGVADKVGLANTASLALMGTFIAPGWGTALGAAAGSVIDLSHANDDLEHSINRLNAAARTSDFTGMGDQIEHVKKQVDDLKHTTGVGDFFSDQAKKAGSFFSHLGTPNAANADRRRGEAAVANAEAARDAARTRAQLELLGQGYEATAEGAKHATASTQDFQRSLQKLNDVLTGRADMRDFEASIDDFSKSLKDNGKTLDINTEKGRNNQAALDAIASTALKVAQNLTGTQRATFLDAARADFIKAARQAGMAKDAAKALADQVLGLKNVKGQPKIVIDADGAWRVLNDIQQRLNQFHDKTIRVTVLSNLSQANKNNATTMDIHSGSADGGTISGPRYPYADKLLVPLAPGEEVISNRYGQADKWRPFLKAINRGLADGGTVGSTKPVSTLSVPSITVLFPTPVQLNNAVRAANLVAAASAKTARTAKDIRQDHLDDLHTQQQIRDIQRELDAKTKKGRLKLRGLDRAAAQAELADAKAQLAEIRRRTLDARAEARQAAVDELRQRRQDTVDALNGNFDLFARGTSPARAEASVERQIQDVAQYGQTVARLKAAGASPSLLRQVIARGESGDFRSAIRFGQALLANPAMLGQLNSSLAKLDTVTASVATLTTDPRFLSPTAWNPTGQVARVVQVQLVADPSAMLLDLQRTISHEVSAQLAAAVSQ